MSRTPFNRGRSGRPSFDPGPNPAKLDYRFLVKSMARDLDFDELLIEDYLNGLADEGEVRIENDPSMPSRVSIQLGPDTPAEVALAAYSANGTLPGRGGASC